MLCAVLCAAVDDDLVKILGIKVIQHAPQESSFAGAYHALDTADERRLKQRAAVLQLEELLVDGPGFARDWNYWQLLGHLYYHPRDLLKLKPLAHNKRT